MWGSSIEKKQIDFSGSKELKKMYSKLPDSKGGGCHSVKKFVEKTCNDVLWKIMRLLPEENNFNLDVDFNETISKANDVIKLSSKHDDLFLKLSQKVINIMNENFILLIKQQNTIAELFAYAKTIIDHLKIYEEFAIIVYVDTNSNKMWEKGKIFVEKANYIDKNSDFLYVFEKDKEWTKLSFDDLKDVVSYNFDLEDSEGLVDTYIAYKLKEEYSKEFKWKEKSIEEINTLSERFIRNVVTHLHYIINKEKTKKDIYLDTLTQLPNRNYLLNLDEYYLKQDNFTFVALDLDKFKEVNDSYWHDFWDTVLKFVSAILLKNIWDIEWASVIRLWWEEIAILLPNIDKIKLEGILMNIQSSLKKMPLIIPWTEDELYYSTFSMGACYFDGKNKKNMTLWKIWKKADILSYEAKNWWRDKILISNFNEVVNYDKDTEIIEKDNKNIEDAKFIKISKPEYDAIVAKRTKELENNIKNILNSYVNYNSKLISIELLLEDYKIDKISEKDMKGMINIVFKWFKRIKYFKALNISFRSIKIFRDKW